MRHADLELGRQRVVHAGSGEHLVSAQLFEHPIQWVTPSPFWNGVLTRGVDATLEQRTAMRRPELLRFNSDDFMQQAQQELAADPASLVQRKAAPVSFRNPPPGKPAGWVAPLDHLKLYQAVHGDFYLVAASLVCRIPGLPDRLVQPQNGDLVGFVLRRLQGSTELAWVDDVSAPKGKTWLEMTGPLDTVADTESVLPLFPMAYADGPRTRKLFVGLVPTSSADSFRNAGVAAVTPQPGDRTQPRTDPRFDDLDTRVVQQLDALKNLTGTQQAQRVEASSFVLLDLADFFDQNLPEVRQAVSAGSGTSLSGADAIVYSDLDSAIAYGSTKWRQGVAKAWDERDAISGEPNAGAPTLSLDLQNSTLDATTFASHVHDALHARDAATGSPDPTTIEPVQSFESPKYDLRGATRYVIRCVYQRPQCGPLHKDVVSDPSRQFALATFFDLDAPARPIHIILPIDTTIAGLRKAPKNVAFLLSNQLRSQLNLVSDAKEALKGNIGPGGEFDLGMICSFSIPIITICALLVLMIFLILLNIVFWWLPFLKICFPIPLFKDSSE
jgi:hypothetical protein